jgi:hypothetical protein
MPLGVFEFIFLKRGFPRKSKLSPPDAAVEEDDDVVLRDKLGGTSELCRTADEAFAFLSLAARIRRCNSVTHAVCSSLDLAWNKCLVWIVLEPFPLVNSILGPPAIDIVDTIWCSVAIT